MTTTELLARLKGVRRSGSGWIARCPAHGDRAPSLSVAEGEKGVVIHCHAGCETGAVMAALGCELQDLFRVESPNGHGQSTFRESVAIYDYTDENGDLLYQVLRYGPKKEFRQRTPDGAGGWEWKLGNVRRVPYRLPAILEAVALNKAIAVVEGEKDADRLAFLGVAATTNAGGAGKWRPEYAEALRDATVVVIPDNDQPGREHARSVARSLAGVAAVVRVLDLPGLPRKGDVSDWLDAGGTVGELRRLARTAPTWSEESEPCEGAGPIAQEESETEARKEGPAITLQEFHAYMPMHNYIFVPSRELWPAASVNARVRQVRDGDTDEDIKANVWLDRHRAVEQMSWAPGEPTLIEDRLISQGGWTPRPGCKVFNLYLPPVLQRGDASEAGPWLEHVHHVYPTEGEHIIRWVAHRVQHPGEKVNHALVLGGPQGIGKDTILEPVKHAVGPWNFLEVSPAQLLGRFNGFVKSVVLRISEARDLGDADRFSFYDHLKTYTAAPPDVLLVDEKNIRAYAVPNVCGVIITTNHLVDGILLPADDRRHFVAWSDLTREAFKEGYWNRLWSWYQQGGIGHVAAYLAQLDLSGFNPKAPPPKTPAFWSIVDASRAPEVSELSDALDLLGKPAVTTLATICDVADTDLNSWLRDRKNRRVIPHRMETAGYVPVRNEAAKDGLWKVGGRRQTIYAKRDVPLRDQIAAAAALAGGGQ